MRFGLAFFACVQEWSVSLVIALPRLPATEHLPHVGDGLLTKRIVQQLWIDPDHLGRHQTYPHCGGVVQSPMARHHRHPGSINLPA